MDGLTRFGWTAVRFVQGSEHATIAAAQDVAVTEVPIEPGPADDVLCVDRQVEGDRGWDARWRSPPAGGSSSKTLMHGQSPLTRVTSNDHDRIAVLGTLKRRQVGHHRFVHLPNRGSLYSRGGRADRTVTGCSYGGKRRKEKSKCEPESSFN